MADKTVLDMDSDLKLKTISFEGKSQNPTNHSFGYGVKTFVGMQPKIKFFGLEVICG